MEDSKTKTEKTLNEIRNGKTLSAKFMAGTILCSIKYSREKNCFLFHEEDHRNSAGIDVTEEEMDEKRLREILENWINDPSNYPFTIK
ncbi:MAG TPA: hypothetical protein PK453_22275 [Leptospiraceae bacterium]|nr:hypothetical protein [Leptospiraceae bacterium]HMY67755.1 hypothetical protein [Leptospiraceae bacterium]HNF16405.1 hypothetical protein [Leptospiraceae bacterium]HNF28258.1 hypothetical protein [Leptospiraceae bacterium]HNI99421.1 hypothetical protein [Leptospiraceae bacterium]